VAPVVSHHSAVCQQEVYCLGRIHRAAAAQADDRIYVEGRDALASGFDHRCIWIRIEIVKGEDCDSAVGEKLRSPFHVAAGEDPSVSDQQRSAKTKFRRKSAEPFNRPLAEYQSCS